MKLILKNKISFSVSGAILFFGILAIIFTFQTSKRELIKYEKKNLENSLKHSVASLEEEFNDQLELAENISRQKEILNYLKNKPCNLQNQGILNILKRYEISDKYSSIYILDKDGNTLVSTNPSFVGNNYSFRNYFKESISGKSYVDMAIGATSKVPGYYFSAPIKENQNVLGVLSIKIKSDQVDKIISLQEKSSNLRDDIDLMLIDRLGIVISSSEKDKLYKGLGKLSLNNKEQEEVKSRFGKVLLEGGLGYDKILAELGSENFFEIYNDYDNRYEVIKTKKIFDKPYFLMLETDFANITNIASDISFVLSIFVLLTILGALIFINLFINFLLSKPFLKINQAVSEIKKGNYDFKLDISTKDEFGELARSFNKLTGKLLKNEEEIKNKINQKSKNLEMVNKFMTGRELKMKELKKEIKSLKKELNNKKNK